MKTAVFTIKDHSDITKTLSYLHTNYSKANFENKPLVVEIKPESKDRSKAQNRLYWKWLHEIHKKTGNDEDQLHFEFKKKFLISILKRDDDEYAAMCLAISALKQSESEQFEAIANGVKLAQEITNIFYKSESGPMTDFLSSMNIQFSDAQGKARDLSAIYLDLAKKFDSGKFSKEQFFNLATGAGFGAGEVDAIMKGRAELQKLIETQQKNSLITQKQAETARELMRSFTELKQNVASTSREFVDFVAPYLHEFLGTLKEVFGWLEENEDFVVGALAAIGGVIALTLVPAIAAAVALTAPVVGLAAAIGLLWEDYQTWKKGGNSFINWAVWEKEIREATEAIDKMWESLMRLTGSTDKVFSFKSVLKSAFGEVAEMLHDILRTITNVATALEFLFEGDWKRAARVLVSTESNEAIRNLTEEQLDQPIPDKNVDASMGFWRVIKERSQRNLIKFLFPQMYFEDKPKDSGQPAIPYRNATSVGGAATIPKDINARRMKYESMMEEEYRKKGFTSDEMAILKAQVHQESGFNPDAKSPAGAKGITQFMPATAERFKVKFGNSQEAVRSQFAGQAAYMRWLLNQFGGNWDNALAGYNAGEGSVNQYGGIPPFRETQNYVKNIRNLSNQYKPKKVSNMPQGMGARAQEAIRQAAVNSNASNRSNSSNVETNIGTINIHTAATDANMIAQNIKSAITERNLAFGVYDFDSGMS